MLAPLFVIALAGLPAQACDDPVAPYEVGPGDGVERPLCGLTGDAERGRAVVAGRRGNCLACHAAPIPEEPFHGTIGPPLHGVGAVYSAAELRLRLVDSTRVNPNTVMPPFHRADGLNGVRRDRAGQPILSAREIEDVIAYLLTLREDAPVR